MAGLSAPGEPAADEPTEPAELTELTAGEPAATAAERRTRVPAALWILVVYVASRLLTFLFLLLAARIAPADSRFGAGDSIDRFVTAWDAQWYWLIAFQGYPTSLPHTPEGMVAENAWAFMPVYAWTANVVGVPLGSWGAGAAVVSLVSGYVGCLAMYRLLRPRLPASAAMWAVVFFANGPLAALFHVGYAEAMFTALLLLALGCLVRREFGWLYLLIPVMGFTRPGLLPFALLLGLYGLWRWHHRAGDPLPVRQIVHIVALGALATVVGFAWQVVAGIVTGDMGAYLSTELAWRRNWIPGEVANFTPFEGWVAGMRFWFGHFGISPVLGWVAFAAVLGAVAFALVSSRSVRAVGIEVRLWSFSYLLYLLAVFFPQSSTLRLLMPLSPLWGAVAAPKSSVWRISVLAGCIVYQWFWIVGVFAHGTDITQVP